MNKILTLKKELVSMYTRTRGNGRMLEADPPATSGNSGVIPPTTKIPPHQVPAPDDDAEAAPMRAPQKDVA